MNKLVTPTVHGIIDYLFTAIQVATPLAMGLNKKAQNAYTIMGSTFGVLNALTDTPVGVKPVISFKTHQKTDAAFLAGLSLLSFAGFIGRDKKARTFHLSFLATAITHYVLTDYDADTNGGSEDPIVQLV